MVNRDSAQIRPKSGTPTIEPERQTIGVIGGDNACIRAVVHFWTGRAPSTVLTKGARVIRLANLNNHHDLVFLLEPTAQLNPWPGGELIWLFPERGPSEPELAQLRLALTLNEAAAHALRILICLPPDLDYKAAHADLDIISETLFWAVAPNVELEVEAVWLSGSHEPTLSSWLAALDAQE